MVTVLTQDVVRASSSKSWYGSALRGVVLAITFVFFVAPLYAGSKFALQDNNGAFSFSPLGDLTKAQGFSQSFALSTELTVVTMIGVLFLVVPTVIFIHLRMPALIRVLEIVSLMPIVFPPIIIVLGFMHEAPGALLIWPYHLAPMYLVLTLPFVVRAIEAGLSSIDVRTLVDAARSLGASFLTILRRVLLPNLSSAIISSSALVIAFVYSEYTMAQFQQRPTLPVWIAQFAMSSGHISTAAAMVSLIGAWLLLSVVLLVDLARTSYRKKRSETL